MRSSKVSANRAGTIIERRTSPAFPRSVDLQLSEQLCPEETVAMLAAYFEQMIAPVFNNFRHPTKFRGADLLVLFEAINFAPRLEQATRNRGLDILVSRLAALSRFPLESVGEISIKGNAKNLQTSTTKSVP
jgi:hypothetical protein